MTLYEVEIARGLGSKKRVAMGSVSKANSGSFDTGLSSVNAVVLTSSSPSTIVTAKAISGGTVTIGLKNHAGSAVTSAKTIYYLAIGD